MPRFTQDPPTRPRQALGHPQAATLTAEGGIGHVRDAKSELFLLAVTNLVGTDSFYESASQRDSRYVQLIHEIAGDEEGQRWLRGFLPWLRNQANMRTASVVGGIEYALAGEQNRREVINSVLQRPDEPGEAVGYWLRRTGRSTLPGGIQRGIADAVVRLYNEKAVGKYNSSNNRIQFANVIELTHPRPVGPKQSELFRYLVQRRHRGSSVSIPDSATMLRTAYNLTQMDRDERSAFLHQEYATEAFKAAGWTWEDVSSWAGGLDANGWKRVIPLMNYMALLRNLRNFEEAGISRGTKRYVEDILTDPDQVRRSKQFPLRFLSAWKALDSARWGEALEDALDASLSTVPRLGGRSLVLIDMSGSMGKTFRGRRPPTINQPHHYEQAVVFGLAVAGASDDADVFVYSQHHHRLDSRRILRGIEEANSKPDMFWGTNTFHTLQETFDRSRHDRVVIATDEQTRDNPEQFYNMPRDVPVYTFNVGGDWRGHGRQLQRDGWYVFGGLSDQAFVGLEALEHRRNHQWPFEIPST